MVWPGKPSSARHGHNGWPPAAAGLVLVACATFLLLKPPAAVPADTGRIGKSSPSAASRLGPVAADEEAVDPATPVPEAPPGAAWGGPMTAALHRIFGLGDSAARSREIESAANAVAIADMAAVLDYLRAFDKGDPASNLVADLSNRLLARWSAADLAALSTWTARLPEGTLREDSIATVIRSTLSVDPGQAESWARGLPEGDARNLALGALAEQQVVSSPAVALGLLKELSGNEGDPQRDSLMNVAASEWAHGDPAAAAAWARQLVDPAMKDQVVSGVAVSWSEKDPAAAADLAARDMTAGPTQSCAIISVVRNWVEIDPEKAAEWVSGFPPGDLKTETARNLVAFWSQKDPAKAASWQRRQPK